MSNENKMDQLAVEEAIKDRLLDMMKEDPVKLSKYLLLITGELMVEAQASELQKSMECNVKGKRYKVSSITTITEIEQ